ncbi:hypothetical protein MIMGU_mgv1a0212842mg, partial [Erythranthe guttata]
SIRNLSTDFSNRSNRLVSDIMIFTKMSLWAEHLGCIENCFKNPENLECVKYTNSIADNNWKRYIAEEYSSLQGHILKYPVKVEVDGKVNHLPGQKLFPDVGGLVLGNPTCLPDLITT